MKLPSNVLHVTCVYCLVLNMRHDTDNENYTLKRKQGSENISTYTVSCFYIWSDISYHFTSKQCQFSRVIIIHLVMKIHIYVRKKSSRYRTIF